MPGKRKVVVDPAILQELLQNPEIREIYDKMRPEVKKWYRKLLVDEGIYSHYLKERKYGVGIRRNNQN